MDRYRLVLGGIAVGLLLAVMGCGGTSSSDNPVQAGGSDEDSQPPDFGTLSLDNAPEISRRATQSALEALSLHQFILAYQALLPWSEIRHVICVEGEADLVKGVKSTVSDFQGNEFFGANYDFDGCLKPEGLLYQGKLGVYWDSESTVYVFEMENFSISDSSTATPRMSSGVFALSVGENLLYIDFGSMDGNIIDASIDLGADGAQDAVWPINLNDLRSEGAGLVLLNDV